MSGIRASPTRSRAVTRYALFQIPGAIAAGVALLVATELAWISQSSAVVLLALWIGKDFLLYPLVRHAYDASDEGVAARWIGRTGRAQEDLNPRGYVMIAGELWLAETTELGPPIHAGERVCVERVEGLCLRVRRAHGDDTLRST